MSTDRRKPILQKWKFELEINIGDVVDLLEASGRLGSPRQLFKRLGRATSNFERYFEASGFYLLEDGTLSARPNQPLVGFVHIFQVDLTEMETLGALASLDQLLEPGKKNADFSGWSLHAHLKWNPCFIARLMISPSGHLYSVDSRKSWMAIQELEKEPLPC